MYNNNKKKMENTKSSGISLTMVLFIVFLILKLTNNIDWSWWWVTSPLWIGFAIAIAVLLIVGLITVISKLLS
jgi:membrane protein YdbS with pleckstrin-like domain